MNPSRITGNFRSESYDHGVAEEATAQIASSGVRTSEGEAGGMSERAENTYGINPEDSLGGFFAELDASSQDWTEDEIAAVGGETRADKIRDGASKVADIVVPGVIGYGIRAAFVGPVGGALAGGAKGAWEAGVSMKRIEEGQGAGAATLYEKKVSGRDREIRESQEREDDDGNRVTRWIKTKWLQTRKVFNIGQYKGLEATFKVQERNTEITDLAEGMGITFAENGQINDQQEVVEKLRASFTENSDVDGPAAQLLVTLHEQMIMSAFSEKHDAEARKQMVDLLALTAGVLTTEATQNADREAGEEDDQGQLVGQEFTKQLYDLAKQNVENTIKENKGKYMAGMAAEKAVKGALFAWVGGMLRESIEDYKDAREAAEAATIDSAGSLTEEVSSAIEDNRDLTSELSDLNTEHDGLLEKRDALEEAIANAAANPEDVADTLTSAAGAEYGSGFAGGDEYRRHVINLIRDRMGDDFIAGATAERGGRVNGLVAMFNELHAEPNGELAQDFAILVGADPTQGIAGFTPEQITKAAGIAEGISGKVAYNAGGADLMDNFIHEAAQDVYNGTSTIGTWRLEAGMEYSGGQVFKDAARSMFEGTFEGAEGVTAVAHDAAPVLSLEDLTHQLENVEGLIDVNRVDFDKIEAIGRGVYSELSRPVLQEAVRVPWGSLATSIFGTATTAAAAWALASDAKVTYGAKNTTDDPGTNPPPPPRTNITEAREAADAAVGSAEQAEQAAIDAAREAADAEDAVRMLESDNIDGQLTAAEVTVLQAQDLVNNPAEDITAEQIAANQQALDNAIARRDRIQEISELAATPEGREQLQRTMEETAQASEEAQRAADYARANADVLLYEAANIEATGAEEALEAAQSDVDAAQAALEGATDETPAEERTALEATLAQATEARNAAQIEAEEARMNADEVQIDTRTQELLDDGLAQQALQEAAEAVADAQEALDNPAEGTDSEELQQTLDTAVQQLDVIAATAGQTRRAVAARNLAEMTAYAIQGEESLAEAEAAVEAITSDTTEEEAVALGITLENARIAALGRRADVDGLLAVDPEIDPVDLEPLTEEQATDAREAANTLEELAATAEAAVPDEGDEAGRATLIATATEARNEANIAAALARLYERAYEQQDFAEGARASADSIPDGTADAVASQIRQIADEAEERSTEARQQLENALEGSEGEEEDLSPSEQARADVVSLETEEREQLDAIALSELDEAREQLETELVTIRGSLAQARLAELELLTEGLEEEDVNEILERHDIVVDEDRIAAISNTIVGGEPSLENFRTLLTELGHEIITVEVNNADGSNVKLLAIEIKGPQFNAALRAISHRIGTRDEDFMKIEEDSFDKSEDADSPKIYPFNSYIVLAD